MIRKKNNQYVLYSKDGTKKLGTFKTKKAAEAREREIQKIKHAKKKS